MVIYQPSGSVWYKRNGSHGEDERVAKLVIAHQSLINNTTNKMKSERDYLSFYNDMKEYESQWFDDILSNVYNFNLCDGLIVVLGNLASLKRNRNEIEIAYDILQLDKKVLDIYEKIVNTPGLVHSCCSCPFAKINGNLQGLKYKYSIIWLNFLPQMKSKSLIVHDEEYDKKLASYYRQCIWYEIAYDKLNEEDIVFAGQLYVNLNRRPTLNDINNISDKDLLVMLDDITKQEDHLPEETRHLSDKLARQAALTCCYCCQKKEEMRGDFKCCGKCKKVYYCSQLCQKTSWKGCCCRYCYS
jgi:hypothetical protein